MPLVSKHRPTIGRNLWLWMPSQDGVCDPLQAFDAKVVFVHPDGDCSIVATTHTGAPVFIERIEVHDPSDDYHNVMLDKPYATWMPYQKAVMDAQGEPK